MVLLDILLPGEDGLAVLHTLREETHRVPILMISALNAADTIVNAVQLGAAGYVTKPFDAYHLHSLVARHLQGQTAVQPATQHRLEPRASHEFHDLIGRTTAMQELYTKLARIAPQPFPVLLAGETGTGKELVARALHKLSPRRAHHFVALNCAAVPESLIESELFGHERGAFTGAHARQVGQFELADRGTLFLDEISELGLPLQAKLLRVLQEREIRRVGGTHPIKVDVRVIAATNTDLKNLVTQGRFRTDLFYRLKVFPIQLPALRERQPDIPLLVEHFLTRVAQQQSRGPWQISVPAMQLLMQYPWPGNVRELEHAIEQACVLCDDPVLLPKHFEVLQPRVPTPPTSKPSKLSGRVSLDRAVRDLERQMIMEALVQQRYVQTRAAAQLGITRRQLRYRMNVLGINLPDDQGCDDGRNTPPPVSAKKNIAVDHTPAD